MITNSAQIQEMSTISLSFVGTLSFPLVHLVQFELRIAPNEAIAVVFVGGWRCHIRMCNVILETSPLPVIRRNKKAANTIFRTFSFVHCVSFRGGINGGAILQWYKGLLEYNVYVRLISKIDIRRCGTSANETTSHPIQVTICKSKPLHVKTPYSTRSLQVGSHRTTS